MENRLAALHLAMIRMDGGKPQLAQHLAKVHSYARLIALTEGIGGRELEIIEAAALVHDIAIPFCLERYGSDAGHLQEREGAAMARHLLAEMGFEACVADRAADLVAEHHTYDPMDGIDHQILVEADFIVNSLENGYGREQTGKIFETIFKTPAGRQIYRDMFGLGP